MSLNYYKRIFIFENTDARPVSTGFHHEIVSWDEMLISHACKKGSGEAGASWDGS